jgi:hypothetical protein
VLFVVSGVCVPVADSQHAVDDTLLPLSSWHQVLQELLLYASALGSVGLVTMLLDEFHVAVDALAQPLVCFDCDPMRLASQCQDGSHGIGSESALISASLAGHAEVVEVLCKRGANPNVQNEVRRGLCGAVWGCVGLCGAVGLGTGESAARGEQMLGADMRRGAGGRWYAGQRVEKPVCRCSSCL